MKTMKLGNRMLALFAAAAVSAVGAGAAFVVSPQYSITASAVTSADDFTVEEKDDGVEIVSYNGKDARVIIPETIDGKKVVSIGKNAFDTIKLTAVAIPDSVTSIDENAFVGCSNLTTAAYESCNEKAWKKLVKGVKNLEDAEAAFVHKWDGGKVTVPPADDKDGVRTYTCLICGEERNEAIASENHEHTFSNGWTKNDYYHWHAATCGHSAVSGKEGHKWDDGNVTMDTTETKNGVIIYTCSVCGAQKAVLIPAGTRAVSEQHTASEDWVSDKDGHWHPCEDCDEKLDYAAHSENDGVVTVQPTETSEGEITYRCRICGEVTRTETVPAVGSEHIHKYGKQWRRGSKSHWHECGCGEKADIAEHTEDEGVVTKEATASESGLITYSCKECGYVMRTETIAPAGSAQTSDDGQKPEKPEQAAEAGENIPFIAEGEGKNGWDSITEEIASAADGSEVEVNMNGAMELPKAVSEAAAGRNVNLVAKMGNGITWTINGESIFKPKSVNLGVVRNARTHIPEELLEEVKGVSLKQYSLDYNSDLGFTGTLTIEPGKKYDGLYANMYGYNSKTKELELIDCDLIENGRADISVSYASEYAVVISEEPRGNFEDFAVSGGLLQDGDLLNVDIEKSYYDLTCTAALLAVGAAGAAMLRKRRQK